MPSPYRERLISCVALLKESALHEEIDRVRQAAETEHPHLFVSKIEELERNWIPPSVFRFGRIKHANH